VASSKLRLFFFIISLRVPPAIGQIKVLTFSVLHDYARGSIYLKPLDILDDVGMIQL
jgi:hypothetical protein